MPALPDFPRPGPSEPNVILPSSGPPAQSVPWIPVVPNPGFCAKCRTTQGNKVFLNICYSDSVPQPRDVSEEELVSMLASEEAPNFLIPMSIGDHHIEVDKAGLPVSAYDIALHTKLYKRLQTSEIFTAYIMSITIQAIEEKFGIEMEPFDTTNCKYIILKNRKVIGKLQTHRIQQREIKKAPGELIKEITPTGKVPKPKPQYTCKTWVNVQKYPSEGPTKFLIADIGVKVDSSEHISLDIGEDRIVVSLPSIEDGLLLDAFFPYKINQDKTCAFFDQTSQPDQLNLRHAYYPKTMDFYNFYRGLGAYDYNPGVQQYLTSNQPPPNDPTTVKVEPDVSFYGMDGEGGSNSDSNSAELVVATPPPESPQTPQRMAPKRANTTQTTRPNIPGRSQICRICGKCLSSPASYYVHMKVHSDNKPYKCPDCEASFTRKPYLEAHIRTHTGERPFQCNVCEKRFSQKSSLNTHQRVHSGERPYACEICHKRFALKSYVVSHRFCHVNEKPLPCDICNMNFTSKGAYLAHVRSHNMDSFWCLLCHKSFVKGSYLIRHNNKFHRGHENNHQQPIDSF